MFSHEDGDDLDLCDKEKYNYMCMNSKRCVLLKNALGEVQSREGCQSACVNRERLSRLWTDLEGRFCH